MVKQPHHTPLLLAVAALLAGTASASTAHAQENPSEDSVLVEGASFTISDSPFESLEIACVEDQDADACFEAAQSWRLGRGIDRPDPTQAVHLYAAGCAFGHARACLESGRMYLLGLAGIEIIEPDGAVSIDFGEASRLLELACSAELKEGCGLLGDLCSFPRKVLPAKVSVFRNFEADLLRGVQSYERGCPDNADEERDTHSCAQLGTMYSTGTGGVRRNNRTAANYYLRACTAEGSSSKWCTAAEQALSDQPIDAISERPRTSVQPHRPIPDTRRFRSSDTGIQGPASKADRGIRLDLEGGIGARWTYGEDGFLGLNVRVGLNVWFNVIGLGLDTAFTTDKFADVGNRNYSRFDEGLIVKFAWPLGVRIPGNLTLHLGAGAGVILGALKLDGGFDWLFCWGARQQVQLFLITDRNQGPRQWGSLRLEQQQSWHEGSPTQAEHSTQLLFVGGFTFGSWGPDWKRIRKAPDAD